MSPPAIHAAKNKEVPPAAPATIDGVRKMPMPTTRLNTTIATSKEESRARIGSKSLSSAMQCFLEQTREFLDLIQIIVKLCGDAQQRHGMRMQPSLDAAFAEPIVQASAVEPVSGSSVRGRRQRYGRHRSEHRFRAGNTGSR